MRADMSGSVIATQCNQCVFLIEVWILLRAIHTGQQQLTEIAGWRVRSPSMCNAGEFDVLLFPSFLFFVPSSV
jgi:hypothetical protein